MTATGGAPIDALKRVQGLMLDLDGTLYVSDALLPRTPELFEALDRHGIPRVFLTNNSSASAKDYQAKLSALGIAARPDQVLTSGVATIRHLQREDVRSAYVVGTPSLRAEFEEAGIALDAEDPDCLVVGYDTTLDYEKLCVATRLLFAGKPYFATHPDLTCISDRGLLPDIAATIAGLQAVTGRAPVILGKPELPMVQAAAEIMGAELASLAMVGDQLDTDMTMAARHGLLSVLVLTGETDREKLRRSPIEPEIVVADVGELAELIRTARGG